MRILGIVNVTPDSFSDGGRYLDPSAAVAHGLSLLDSGCDFLDVGGESTRPGSEPVAAQEELERVIPVIEGLVVRGAEVSVDTQKAEVALAALESGATWVNDVRGLRDPEMQDVVRKLRPGVIIMHLQGTPATMQHQPEYDNVVEEVLSFLAERAEWAASVGCREVWMDPGIGFGKTFEHNWALLNALPQFVATGFPVLLGISRKRFLGPDASLADRDAAAVPIYRRALEAGVHAVRVHDPEPVLLAMMDA